MRKLIFAACAMSGMLAQAINVNVTDPGTLNKLITNLSETTLTITGTVNAADLYFAGQDLKALQTLNLSGATVAAYDGAELTGAAHYDAGLIPAGAFAGTKLQNVVLGAGISTVGMGAFAGCTALQSVNLAGVCAIGDAAFKGCTALELVADSESVTTYGDMAFDGCTALKEFDFGQNVTSIGQYAFAHTGLQVVNLSGCDKLTTIGARAFANNKSLEQVSFNENANPALGDGLFFGDSALVNIVFPPTVTAIPAHAMTGASSVNIFVMPRTSKIGEHAMTNMTGLTKIDATKLTDVPEAGDDVWANLNKHNIELQLDSDEIANMFKTADQWKEFDITYQRETDVVDNIIADATHLRGRFVGKLLEIEGAPMSRVELFDISGRQLKAVTTDTDHLSIDTTPFATNIYVVNVTLADGTRGTLKLARR